MNGTITLTTNEAIAGGAILGGLFASIGIFALVFYVLMIIAYWKIFTKAGEEGWKSLIPIYNLYIFCRIIGISFWIYMIIAPLILGVLCVVPVVGGIATVLSGCYSLFLLIFVAIKLGDAFKKSVVFKVGLVLLPNLFLLILAFGSSKYHHKRI